MLKKFFLNFLSSFVATWLAIGLFLLTLVILFVSLAMKIGFNQSGNSESLKKNSVLLINLKGEIEERQQPADVNYMNLIQGNLEPPQTLTELTAAINEAKDNDDVKMIYLKCGGLSAGSATLHSLRKALLGFRESGKKIYAYGEAMGNSDYFIASVADSLFFNANGLLALNGLSAGNFYLKDLLDKVGIEVQVTKVGTFKSAVEPYISNEMSQPARAQLDTLLGNIWSMMTDEIAKSRTMKAARFAGLVAEEHLMVKPEEFYKRSGLVDALVYERSMDQRIADALNVKKEKVNYISPATLAVRDAISVNYGASDQIAVLYAVGEIMEGRKSGINCEVLVPVITELADNDDVKGMVLRVNSPGGSVFGSEQIAEALAYFQSKGKPLAVSMGDYAASGGYWISCHADRIFADPMTITGSIGIFGMFPNASKLIHNIGVNPQIVETSPGANFPSLIQPMTESQLAAMQEYINAGYDKFIRRVAVGRKMPESKVRQIAEGRVWDGGMALKLGLVDSLGGLSDAIDWVKSKAEGKKKFNVVTYPEIESGFWDMVQLSMQTEGRIMLIREAMKIVPESRYATEVGDILRRKPVQARILPVVVK